MTADREGGLETNNQFWSENFSKVAIKLCEVRGLFHEKLANKHRQNTVIRKKHFKNTVIFDTSLLPGKQSHHKTTTNCFWRTTFVKT